jgi:Leucine-rich repeat (LRR) protein
MKKTILILFLFASLLLFSSTSLAHIPGDFNLDGQVDFEDLMIFALAYGSTPSSSNWDTRCDLHPDNHIDFEDLMLFAMNYGKVYEPEEGITEVVSAQIDLETGGVIEVTDETSEIYGSRLVIDPIDRHALAGSRGISEIKIILNALVTGSNNIGDYQGWVITPVGISANDIEGKLGLLKGTWELAYNEDKLNNSGVAKNSDVNVYRVACFMNSITYLLDPIPNMPWEKVPAEKITHETNKVKIDLDLGDFLYMYSLTVTNCKPPTDIGTPLPGDLVYRLSKSVFGNIHNWNPGHVGIYVGERYNEEDGTVYNVIEALGSLIGPKEVFRKPYPDITKFGGGEYVYMGAREPATRRLTHAERNRIITFLEEQVGKPYATFHTTVGVYLGLARGDLVKGPDRYNCVGLAEAAYEMKYDTNFNGIDIVSNKDEGNELPILSQDALLTPQEQLFRTVPATGILDVNNVPVILGIIIDSENPKIGDNVTATCGATDKDGDVLIYEWTIKGRNGEIVGSFNKLKKGSQVNFNIPSNSFSIKCTVSDNYGGEVSDTKEFNLEGDEEIYFEDPNLEQVIREIINRPNGPIYKSDVVYILDIDACERGMESLEGLQHLENLNVLSIYSNQISDLSPLENLINIHSLAFYDNQVSDLSPLENLTNIYYLILDDNQVSDLSPLSNLTNLKSLYFSDNQVSDLSPLSNLANLESLYFSENQVSDLSPLSNLTNLESLGFDKNQVSDLSPLSNLTNLKWLYFFENQVSDLSPLSNLTNLKWLYFSENQVSDLSPLSNLTNLKSLYFSENQVSDLSPLSNLTNLKSLGFSYNQVSNISPLVRNTGFGSGDSYYINMRNNYLDLTEGSQNMKDINTLISRGVTVDYRPQRPKP